MPPNIRASAPENIAGCPSLFQPRFNCFLCTVCNACMYTHAGETISTNSTLPFCRPQMRLKLTGFSCLGPLLYRALGCAPTHDPLFHTLSCLHGQSRCRRSWTRKTHFVLTILFFPVIPQSLPPALSNASLRGCLRIRMKLLSKRQESRNIHPCGWCRLLPTPYSDGSLQRMH